MTENKARTSKPYGSQATFERPIAEGTEAVQKLTEQGVAHAKDMYEKTQAATQETNKVLERTYSTVATGAADFNLKLVEIVRTNTNSAFDLARQLMGVKSPSEFLELSTAHARRQFETYAEQAQQLTALAQKVTTDAVQPLKAGVTSAFNKPA